MKKNGESTTSCRTSVLTGGADGKSGDVLGRSNRSIRRQSRQAHRTITEGVNKLTATGTRQIDSIGASSARRSTPSSGRRGIDQNPSRLFSAAAATAATRTGGRAPLHLPLKEGHTLLNPQDPPVQEGIFRLERSPHPRPPSPYRVRNHYELLLMARGRPPSGGG